MSENNERGAGGHTWVQTIAAIIGVIFVVAAFFGISTIGDFSRPTPTPTTPIPETVTSFELGDTWVRPADGMTMVYVPAGSFHMGSVNGDPEANDDEFPRHEVTLDGFWLDQTEVTNAQFVTFLNAEGNQTQEGATWLDFESSSAQITVGGNPFFAKDGFANRPVVEVTWYGANAYCAWAGGRLPTEAQWEYSARGPENFRYPWGNTPPDSTLLNYDQNENGTVAVGSYPNGTSWVGALDMAGNVWEWTNDWYDNDYYEISPTENPAGPSNGTGKVLRGGGWNNTASFVRAANHNAYPPTVSGNSFGFRCVVALPGVP